jgi:predicted RND superfamily exporter protein
LVVLIVLRPGRPAIVTLVCGAGGVFLLLTLAGLLGIRVNFLDFAALPITIGIGIDYAANFAARHSLESPGVARRIVVTTGPAVILCSFTTAVGYASLMISENQGIHSFGLAALLGELTCIGCALVLAPALLDLGAPNRRRPGANQGADMRSRTDGR